MNATQMRQLDYQLLQALEALRHPDNAADAAATIRDARRQLLQHLDETEQDEWEHTVAAALSPDVRPLNLGNPPTPKGEYRA